MMGANQVLGIDLLVNDRTRVSAFRHSKASVWWAYGKD